MSDQNLIRLWRIFIGLAYLATAAVVLMSSGCTVAQRRTAMGGVETVGIAYTALLTTIATHEVAGHIQDEMWAMRNTGHIRVETRFYRPWEIEENGDVGVEWGNGKDPFASAVQPPGRNFRYISGAERLLRARIDRRFTVHNVLSGSRANSKFYTAWNEGLRVGQVHGRWNHAYALFLGMDATVYSLRDYRNYNRLELGHGDHRDYLSLMGGRRETLRTAFAFDLAGKLPDMWWHMKGTVGINDPAPTFWRFGRWEIRPAYVIIEWRAAPGINATRSF